jgi:hypothetical protein
MEETGDDELDATTETNGADETDEQPSELETAVKADVVVLLPERADAFRRGARADGWVLPYWWSWRWTTTGASAERRGRRPGRDAGCARVAENVGDSGRSWSSGRQRSRSLVTRMLCREPELTWGGGRRRLKTETR